MKEHKVIAEVIDAGHCRYYKKGRRFVLGGFTPAGICDSAYLALSRDAQALRYGGKLPWQKDGIVLTRCPDPEGALWQLRPADDSDIEAITSVTVSDASRDRKPSSLYEISACRGLTGSCPFSLVKRPSLVDEIEAVVAKSALISAARKHTGEQVAHRSYLKLAIAACPNACTQPQIKDIGIIANCTPVRILQNCNGCGQCENVCQEQAIKVRNKTAELLPKLCVGCGLCIKECPQQAIESEGVRFRILAGGKMGRHPKWAQELCVVDGSNVVQAVESFLDKVVSLLRPDEHMAVLVDRIGLARLREEILF